MLGLQIEVPKNYTGQDTLTSPEPLFVPDAQGKKLARVMRADGPQSGLDSTVLESHISYGRCQQYCRLSRMSYRVHRGRLQFCEGVSVHSTLPNKETASWETLRLPRKQWSLRVAIFA